MFVPQNKYVVRINGCPLWKDHKAVTFGMCMGNPNWEGAKFEALLEWASRHFELIRISISDTLGRHNHLMLGLTQEEAMRASLAQGDVWLERHIHLLRSCGKPYEIVRWDDWRKHPDFSVTHYRYREIALHNETFSAMLDKQIKEHLERLQMRKAVVSPESYKHCFDYLIEELAGTTLRARSFGRACRIYPAPEPEWLKLIRSRGVSEAPFGLEEEYYVYVSLRRRKTPVFSSRLAA